MLVVQQIHYILQFTRIWTSNSSVPAFIALLLSLLTSVTAVDWKITLSDVCLLCRLKARSLSPSPSLSFFLPPPSYRPNLAHLALFYGRRHIWIDVCCPWKHCKNGGRGEGRDSGNLSGAGRHCLPSFSCNFNQAVSVTGLAALKRQLRLSFTIIIQVLFPFSLALLRQGQPWLIWAICSADYERRGSPASAPRMLLCVSPHTHTQIASTLSFIFQPSPLGQQYEETV